MLIPPHPFVRRVNRNPPGLPVQHRIAESKKEPNPRRFPADRIFLLYFYYSTMRHAMQLAAAADALSSPAAGALSHGAAQSAQIAKKTQKRPEKALDFTP